MTRGRPKGKAKVPDPPPGRADPPDKERLEARKRLDDLLGVGTPPTSIPSPGAPAVARKDPSKAAKGIVKAVSKEQLEAWQPWGEAFAYYGQLLIQSLFPQDWAKVTADDLKKLVFAWVLFLATCPPENLRTLAIANLGLVHVSMLGSRVVKWAWLRKQEGEKDGKPKSGSSPGSTPGHSTPGGQA